MASTKPRWNTVTFLSKWFIVAYVVAVLITQVYLKWRWYDWVRDITNAILAVAFMLLSIRYGGILTDFYSKLTGFGISEVREDRRGADSSVNELWINRILDENEPLIVGTLSRGWFVTAYENLEHLLSNDKRVTLLVCLLDPFGRISRARIESGQDKYEKFLHETQGVFWNLRDLMRKHDKRVSLQLYDSEPISCVVARGAMYLGLYLPETSRKEVPEFTISTGSFLGKKVYESISKIRDASPSVSSEVLEEYRKTMLTHSNTSRETFLSDPDVFCDFCKERRGLPSEFSRRFPKFGERGSRLTSFGRHFFLVPSLGQLVEDHSLMVSNQHVTSSAQLGVEALKEITDFFDRIKQVQPAGQRDRLFFEHGVPLEGSTYGGCGICHCHIHSLSLPGSFEVDLLENFLTKKGYSLEKKPIKSWDEVVQFRKDSYMCVQSATNSPTVFVFALNTRVESQLMRQFVAESFLSQKEWDWRSRIDNPVTLQAACERLRSVSA
jgi:hypothetical protein